jgi:hypothetical protein
VIDYSEFPKVPKFILPPEIAGLAGKVKKLVDWNVERPCSILEIVSELETLIQDFPDHQALSSSHLNPPGEFDTGVKSVELQVDKKEKKKVEVIDKKVATNLFADRIFEKSKEKEPETQPNQEIKFESAVSNDDYITPEPVDPYSVVEDSGDSQGFESFTSTNDESEWNNITEQSGNQGHSATGTESPKPKKKFMIKPKIKMPQLEVDDQQEKVHETNKGHNIRAAQENSVESQGQVEEPNTQSDLEANANASLENSVPGLNDSSPPVKTQDIRSEQKSPVKKAKAKGFVIPSIDELDSFSPSTTKVKKPKLKPVISKSRVRPKEAERKSQKIKQMDTKPTKKRKEVKKKSNDVPFDWGDDEEEMTISSNREIDDFDFEIKKVDD